MPNDEPEASPENGVPIHPHGVLLDDRASWVPILGAVFAGITLFFFMLLVLAAVIGYDVPPDSRFLVIVVLALGAAMSAAFLGGTAAIHGKLPFPAMRDNPIIFSTAGGIAVLLIVLLFGYFLYVKPATKLNYVVVPLPQQIPVDFSVKNNSTDSIADIGEVRTNGNRRFLYVEFRQNKKNGRISLEFPKHPGPGFDNPEFYVDINGKMTPK